MDTGLLGKGLILLGLLMALLGATFLIAPKIPFLGRLPGDFAFQLGNVKVFAPLATCLVLSLLLTWLLNLLFARR
ncbi:MAG TPA: DUF2905 domain-containing protein [Candidatus Obscuribacterales bacterium]